MLKNQVFVNGVLYENCYLVWDEDSKEGIIVDPGYANVEKIKSLIKKENIYIKTIVNTHGHWDHIYGNQAVMDFTKAHLIIHEADSSYLIDPVYNLSHNYINDFTSPAANQTITEGDIIKLGNTILKVIETPGHTPGSIVIFNKEIALTGDTLFLGSVGRTDFLGGNKYDMVKSIEKIKKKIPKTAVILSGHGNIQIKFSEHLEMNPFLTGQSNLDRFN